MFAFYVFRKILYVFSRFLPTYLSSKRKKLHFLTVLVFSFFFPQGLKCPKLTQSSLSKLFTTLFSVIFSTLYPISQFVTNLIDGAFSPAERASYYTPPWVRIHAERFQCGLSDLWPSWVKLVATEPTAILLPMQSM